MRTLQPVSRTIGGCFSAAGTEPPKLLTELVGQAQKTILGRPQTFIETLIDALMQATIEAFVEASTDALVEAQSRTVLISFRSIAASAAQSVILVTLTSRLLYSARLEDVAACLENYWSASFPQQAQSRRTCSPSWSNRRRRRSGAAAHRRRNGPHLPGLGKYILWLKDLHETHDLGLQSKRNPFIEHRDPFEGEVGVVRLRRRLHSQSFL